VTHEVLAFDIGGTHLRGARWSARGGLGARATAPTPRSSPGALVEALVDLAQGLAGQGAAPAAAGLAIAGTIDRAAGLVRTWPTTGFTDLDVKTPLERALGLPVLLVNDVNAAALGEARAAGSADLAALFLGTGVGTGFVCGGALLEGHRGMAGEGGHLVCQPGGPPCPAGCRGCVESFLGGDALGRRALPLGLPQETRALVAAWRAGDARARGLLDEAFTALAALVSLVINAFDPERIVLGGGLFSAAQEEFLAAARGAVAALPLGHGRRDLIVERARLGADAGLAGAGHLAAEWIESRPAPGRPRRA